MGCTPSILSDNNNQSNNHNNRKDSNIFCANISSRNNSNTTCQGVPMLNSSGQQQIITTTAATPASGTANGSNNEQTFGSLQNYHQNQAQQFNQPSYTKKDSIVSVTGLGHLTGFSAVQTVVRRATSGSGTSSASGRLGHRKSSLALTPEEEPLDTSTTTKPLPDIKFPTLLPPNPQIKVLLVFHKNDNVCDALVSACYRLHFETTIVKTGENALELFQNHHIILVDGRCSKYLDAEIIGRQIRNSKGSQFTTMAAVVKRSLYEKDDVGLLSLLDAGYNRCFMESPHISVCSSELRQIQHSLVRPQNVISTQQALYVALHRAKDAILITDDSLRIQYANKSIERLFNMKFDEIVGRRLYDIILSDTQLITTQTNRLREFDGLITIKRKNMIDGQSLHVHVIPIICSGKQPTHLVITFEYPNNIDTITAASAVNNAIPSSIKEGPRGSVHSIRRQSFDVRSIVSDSFRRTSLAKLSALPLEAPITKVVALLAQVQENCSADEARLLDRVMEFLKKESLYIPQMKEIRTEDPTATDLIGALLTQGPTNIISSRRSSNDSTVRTGRQSSAGLTPNKLKMGTPQVMELLEQSLLWEFDIFKLEELTERRPLVFLGMELFRHFDTFGTFNIDENTFRSWLIVVEAHYHSVNTYHNSTHAADVMQATACFLDQLSQKDPKITDHLDEATALIAAATHDIDHPGRSSAFLCNSDNQLSLLYNDLCVLESHHASTTFRLTLRDDKINIFKNLDRESYKLIRSIIIDMILATEMTRHFEHLAKFVSVFGAESEIREALQQTDNDDNQILMRRMLIKCADVSNPARPLQYCVEWARRIAEEYFMQTDEEKRLSLPIVMPMFDRATCSISKSQIGFIEYIIQDMLNAWDGFIDMPELIQYTQYNYQQWKLFEEQSIHTLNDIRLKQTALKKQPLYNIKTMLEKSMN